MADQLKINPLRKYLRKEKLPHFFCAGCGFLSSSRQSPSA